jgi:glycosyltransferase involved in cell wall biosynthesis
MENPKIGIAMLARNSADIIPAALDPLKDYVDEIAIVLGGESKDNTREVAERYATLPVEDFDGPVFEDDGRLKHFGMARQQSCDILMRAGCRYVMIVDTDDQWEGGENIPRVVEQLQNSKSQMALFLYAYEGGQFIQPRIYDLTTGHWEGPCHNYWEWDMVEPVGMQTDLLKIRQVRGEHKEGSGRRQQNFRISEWWMSENGDNARLLLHMAKDAMVERDFERVEDALERYFVAYESDPKQDPEELYNAYHTKASMHIIKHEYEDALFNAFKALSVRPHGQSWTLASEAAGWLSTKCKDPRPILEMAAFCAEMALDTGKARGNLHWSSDKLAGVLPLFLKARANAGLGNYRKARGALDMGLLLEPEHPDLVRLRNDISRKLGELP